MTAITLFETVLNFLIVHAKFQFVVIVKLLLLHVHTYILVSRRHGIVHKLNEAIARLPPILMAETISRLPVAATAISAAKGWHSGRAALGSRRGV